MRDILVVGDLAKAAAGIPGFQRAPVAGETMVIWESTDQRHNPYRNAMQIEELYLTISSDQPSISQGVLFEGSHDGVEYTKFVEKKTLSGGIVFEYVYGCRTPHVRIRVAMGAVTPTEWLLTLTAKVGM